MICCQRVVGGRGTARGWRDTVGPVRRLRRKTVAWSPPAAIKAIVIVVIIVVIIVVVIVIVIVIVVVIVIVIVIPRQHFLAQKNQTTASFYWYMREQRGTVSSNSRFQSSTISTVFRQPLRLGPGHPWMREALHAACLTYLWYRR